MGGAEQTYRGELHTEFLWRNRNERNHVQDLRVNGKVVLQWIFRKFNGVARTGFVLIERGKGNVLF